MSDLFLVDLEAGIQESYYLHESAIGQVHQDKNDPSHKSLNLAAPAIGSLPCNLESALGAGRKISSLPFE